MPSREWRASAYRHVRLGRPKANRIDDFAFDPRPIFLASDRFKNAAEQSKPMVGVFEPRVGVDHWRPLQISHQFISGQKWPGVGELSGIFAIANDTGAM